MSSSSNVNRRHARSQSELPGPGSLFNTRRHSYQTLLPTAQANLQQTPPQTPPVPPVPLIIRIIRIPGQALKNLIYYVLLVIRFIWQALRKFSNSLLLIIRIPWQAVIFVNPCYIQFYNRYKHAQDPHYSHDYSCFNGICFLIPLIFAYICDRFIGYVYRPHQRDNAYAPCPDDTE